MAKMAKLAKLAGSSAAILLLIGTSACSRGGSDARDRDRDGEGRGTMSSLSRGNSQGKARDSLRSERSADSADSGPADTGPAAPSNQSPAVNTQTTSGASTAADGRDRRVRVVNNSGQTIQIVQGSAVSQGNWGQDRIPTTTLASGGSAIVDFNDNNGECQYDLRVTLADGTKRDQRNVNVCTVTEWTINSGGTAVR